MDLVAQPVPQRAFRRLRDLVDYPPGSLWQRVGQAVKGPDALLEAADDPGAAQLAQMVAHRGLAQLEGRGEITDAHWRTGGPEHVDNLHPSWISQRLVDVGQGIRLL